MAGVAASVVQFAFVYKVPREVDTDAVPAAPAPFTRYVAPTCMQLVPVYSMSGCGVTFNTVAGEVVISDKVTAKLWLVVVNVTLVLAPSTVTVKVSAPATVGVTSNITFPLAFVSGAAAVPESLASPVTVLPAAELNVTAAFGILLPEESWTLNANLAGTLIVRDDAAPVAVTVVPVTATVPLAVTPSPLAVTLMVRLVGLPFVPSVTVAKPLALVVAEAPPTKMPESEVKVTGTPANALLFWSTKTAVKVTSVLANPLDGKVGELSNSEIEGFVAAPPVTITEVVPVAPPPVAVMPMVRGVVLEPSVTTPDELVTAGVTVGVNTPELAANCTVTFGTALLFASSAVAVTTTGVVEVETI